MYGVNMSRGNVRIPLGTDGQTQRRTHIVTRCKQYSPAGSNRKQVIKVPVADV